MLGANVEGGAREGNGEEVGRRSRGGITISSANNKRTSNGGMVN